MEKSTFTPLYEHFRRRLVALRVKAGMTQRDLARKLGRERSFVSRIELGERRIDIVEFYWVVQALGKEAARAAADLMREFARLERAEGSSGTRQSGRPLSRS
jgi:transcriptional regulator with XRE-family HTH domain